jgi:tetratricopeptide (TPR) repeat protein
MNIEIMRHSPGDVQDAIENGYVLLAAGKPSKAKEIFSGAYDRWPSEVRIVKGLGRACLDLNEVDNAEKYFSEVNALERETNAQLIKLIQHAWSLLQQDDINEAENLLREAQIKWPDKIGAFHMHHRILEVIRRRG